MRIGKLILAIVLSFVVACQPYAYSPRTSGDVHMNHKENSSVVEEEAAKPDEYMSDITVATLTLLGLGGASLLMGAIAANAEFSQEDPTFALTSGGIGLVFLGAAGITYAFEE